MLQTQLDVTTSVEHTRRRRWPLSVPVFFTLSFLLVIYMVVTDVVFGINMIVVAQWHPLTADVQNTLSVWAWFLSVPLATILAGVGAAIAAGMSRRRLWLMIGILVAAIGAPLAAGILVTFSPGGLASRFPPVVFGGGGVLIITSVPLTCWFWAQSRAKHRSATRRGSDLRLIAYVLFGLAAWWTCGLASQAVILDSRPVDLISLIYLLMTDLVLGWGLLLASHVLVSRAAGSGEAEHVEGLD